MNVLIASDKNYLEYYDTMLFSLSLCVHEKINAYFLNLRIAKSDMESFAHSLHSYGIELIVINMHENDFEGFPVGERFTPEIYLRLLSQYVLPTNLERILYLDADIVIKKDITDFYYQDFEGNCIVACEDRANNTDTGKKIKNKIGLPDNHIYINAGVLLLNLDLLRTGLSRQELVMKCIEYKDKLLLFDQDLINIIYQKKTKYADSLRYNCQLDTDGNLPTQNASDIYILHYAGKKPWTYYGLTKDSIYFSSIRAMQNKDYKRITKSLYRCKIIDLFQEIKIYIKQYISI